MHRQTFSASAVNLLRQKRKKHTLAETLLNIKVLVFRAEINKMLARIANREDLGLHCLSRLFDRFNKT